MTLEAHDVRIRSCLCSSSSTSSISIARFLPFVFSCWVSFIVSSALLKEWKGRKMALSPPRTRLAAVRCHVPGRSPRSRGRFARHFRRLLALHLALRTWTWPNIIAFLQRGLRSIRLTMTISAEPGPSTIPQKLGGYESSRKCLGVQSTS